MLTNATRHDDCASLLGEDDSAILFAITAPADGYYAFTVNARISKGFAVENPKPGEVTHKLNHLYVDGKQYAEFAINSGERENAVVRRIYLSKGEHTAAIVKSWGFIDVFHIEIAEAAPMPSDIYTVGSELLNPNASDNAKRLYAFLRENYGKKIITGQQVYGLVSKEMETLKATTGKLPLLGGFDFIENSHNLTYHDAPSDFVGNAIKWHNAGGITTFCWHWTAPCDTFEDDAENPVNGSFYTKHSKFDIAKTLDNPDSEAYRLLIKDIDLISDKIKLLADNGVPILWRPLHEASGAWFWWGARGADACVKLWKLIYDRMTNVHKLNNLIWVWNGQDVNWYPGDEYCDIIGEDIYPGKQQDTPQYERFMQAYNTTQSRKIIALSENGCIPDIDMLVRDNVMWSWFCVWGGMFVYKQDENGETVYSDEYTKKDILLKAYNHERALTLDNAPRIFK